MREALEAGRTWPFIADPGWGHPGDTVSSGASTSVGWGIHSTPQWGTVAGPVVLGTEKRVRAATLHEYGGWD